MAVRKTSGKMQKTLNDLKQEREVVAQAIDQLEGLLHTLRGGGKRRGRPKKVATHTATKRPAAAKTRKTTAKRVTKKATRATAQKAPARRSKRAAAR